MLLKSILPSFALGASVADYLGENKPVAIIDEFEVQGDQIETFLNLHFSIFDEGYQKDSGFIKNDEFVDMSSDFEAEKMCTVVLMSYWNNEKAAEEARADTKLENEFNNALEKMGISSKVNGQYPRNMIFSIIGPPAESGSPTQSREILFEDAFSSNAWKTSAYPYKIPGNLMQQYIDLESEYWGTFNGGFSFYQRNSEFVSNDCDLTSPNECYYLNLNFWSDREEVSNINGTEVGEVNAAFNKAAAERNITFEYVGPFPGAGTDGLANLNGRKTEDPRENDTSQTIASMSLLLLTLLFS
ncbi:Oidioi.mRNA.OKI2018_I69.chr2.g4973.t1.cds [Oikopleura dioica]|uniref:Oidioi.mRNA.OKI2018_I69.chr2.g4973.t1.cds n=1 Tax=Oikopleura dioica TaxID=34765 RepID=A0ABN7SZ39_OIKDI|nr:Oidioi.mRNA.OKI2018_I69.chr2.g4973.t1.cds [Oikopleura dioica]